MHRYTDLELIARTEQGESEAAAELFHRHYQAAVKHAHAQCHSAATAEDLAAEAFARTLSRIRAGARIKAFRPYILTAVRNLYRGQLRRKTEFICLENYEGEPESHLVLPDPTTETVERIGVLEAIASLPPAQREVLELVFLHGYTNADLAAELGTSANAAASLTYRARMALRQLSAPAASEEAELAPTCSAG